MSEGGQDIFVLMHAAMIDIMRCFERNGTRLNIDARLREYLAEEKHSTAIIKSDAPTLALSKDGESIRVRSNSMRDDTHVVVRKGQALVARHQDGSIVVSIVG